MRSPAAVALTVSVVLLTACQPSAGADEFLVDQPGLLSAEQAQRIRRYHRQLLADLDIDFKVVILEESPASLDAAALGLFEAHAVGGRTRGAKGLLLVIDPTGREARVETGYDLEPIFPDGFVGYVQREQMAPFYRAERVADGIEGAVELLVGRATGAIDAHAYDPSAPASAGSYGSGGGGARARLDARPQPVRARAQRPASAFGPQPSPEAAFAAYLDVLEGRIKDADLALYSPATQDLLRTRVVTSAQQQNELAAIREVYGSRIIKVQGSLAVIRFGSSRRVPPYFLRRQEGGWTIDLAAASRVIGFDQLNQWYVRDVSTEFAFGL